MGIGTTTPANLLHLYQGTATTNSVTIPLRIENHTTGTVANNFGVGLSFYTQYTGGQYEAARISAVETTTDGTSDLSFGTNVPGVGITEYLRIKSGGAVVVNNSFQTIPSSPNSNGGSGNIPLTTSAFVVANGNWVSPLTLPAGPPLGQHLIIFSTASLGTTINTTNTSLTAPLTMNNGDAYEFISNGTVWCHVH